MVKLTIKQEAFCLEYAASGNATEAYKKAGFKVQNDNVAAANATRLLRNAKVKNRIKELMEEMRAPKIAEATEVLEYLTAVMRGESSACEVVIESQEVGVSKARLVIKPPSEKERTKAAELLGKRYCLFKEVQTEAEYENPFKDLSEEDLLKLTKVSDEDD